MDWNELVYGWPLVNYLAIFLLPAAFFSSTDREKRELWRTPQVKIAVFLLFAASISWLFYLHWFGGAWQTFQDFGKIILLYCLIILLVRDMKSFRIILWAVLLCIAWMAVHGILQIHRGYGFGGAEPLFRKENNIYQIKAFGIFSDPNDLCLVFILALPLLYSELRSLRNFSAKMASGGIIALVVCGAWLTNSRGGFVGLAGMLGALVTLKTKGLRRLFFLICCYVLLILSAPSRVASDAGVVDTGRSTAWGDGIAMFKKYPIFGVGFNGFQDISSEGMVAHNSYISTLTELGLLGYIPWFLLISLTMVQIYRAIKLAEPFSREDSHRLIAIFAALFGYLGGIYFLSRAYDYVLYIFLGFALAETNIVSSKYGFREQIFDAWKKDAKRLVFAALASIPCMWTATRIANALGRG